MKESEDAARELPLNDEQVDPVFIPVFIPVKKNRHVTIAINHLRKRRTALEAQDRAIRAQLEEIDIAIEALE